MSWIQTYTGKAFYPLAPRLEDIDIRDIAHGLALKCRFNGQCTRFYSVAEHSVYVAWAVAQRCQGLTSNRLTRYIVLQALLHDAAEAYLADIPRPVKPMIEGWREIEDRVEQEIFRKYGLPLLPWSWVKDADTQVLANEREALMPSGLTWDVLPVPLPNLKIMCLSPIKAERFFLKAFELFNVD